MKCIIKLNDGTAITFEGDLLKTVEDHGVVRIYKKTAYGVGSQIQDSYYNQPWKHIASFSNWLSIIYDDDENKEIKEI